MASYRNQLRTAVGSVFAIVVLVIFAAVVGHYALGWNVPVISPMLGR